MTYFYTNPFLLDEEIKNTIFQIGLTLQIDMTASAATEEDVTPVLRYSHVFQLTEQVEAHPRNLFQTSYSLISSDGTFYQELGVSGKTLAP